MPRLVSNRLTVSSSACTLCSCSRLARSASYCARRAASSPASGPAGCGGGGTAAAAPASPVPPPPRATSKRPVEALGGTAPRGRWPLEWWWACASTPRRGEARAGRGHRCHPAFRRGLALRGTEVRVPLRGDRGPAEAAARLRLHLATEARHLLGGAAEGAEQRLQVVLLPLGLRGDLAVPPLGPEVPLAHRLGQRGRLLARGDRHRAAHLRLHQRDAGRLGLVAGVRVPAGLGVRLGGSASETIPYSTPGAASSGSICALSLRSCGCSSHMAYGQKP